MKYLILAVFFPVLIQAQTPEISLTSGLVIRQSCTIKTGLYRLNGAVKDVFTDKPTMSAAQPVLSVEGENLTIDFNNAQLQGSNDRTQPDEFYGLAIRVTGKNITLRNLKVKGYKVGLWAEGSVNLRLENCDFSYNYRPRLHSGREHEDFSDWLSYHQNAQNEWLGYGAGIYLDSCQGATVKNCRITGCQNALLMNRCTDGLIYNNTFQFNSGLGIGLYRSSNNRLMHNKLDWNVRGYSHGFYARGQDSAALLLYEQSSNNLIAFNSCTHSGDGLFLWAGQTTMDSGKGGCNDNYIFGNDFSHSPTNGIEVTFSRNRIRGNLITECTNGIWGGYSYHSIIMGNLISNCRTGIAIEHGQNDTIQQNLFQDDSVGIQVWARDQQPADWGYAQSRDVRSRDHVIDRNVFLKTRNPLKISASENIRVNGENLFSGFSQLLQTPKPNVGLKFWRNEIYGTAAQVNRVWATPEIAKQENLNFSYPEKVPKNPYAPLETPVVGLNEPDSLPDGMLAALPAIGLRGREFIQMGEWGPYDFQRPIATFKADLTNGLLVYYILCPPGNWRINRTSRGLDFLSDTASTRPLELTLRLSNPPPDYMWVELEFRGDGPTVNELGQVIPAGTVQRFYIRAWLQKFKWVVNFHNYTDATHPLIHADAFAALLTSPPIASLSTDNLYYAWWENPATNVQSDHFATTSTTSFAIAPGNYTLSLTSDDGARLYLDDKLLIDHWDVHEPAVDSRTLRLGGKHTIRIEHFDGSGFSTLDFRIKPVD